MSDAEWKRAQNEPLSGEGDLHFKGKCRIRTILQRCGFYSTLEYRFSINSSSPEDAYHFQYRADVAGITPNRFICVEVDGPRGHKTQRSHDKSAAKYRQIKEKYGNYIEVYTFHYKRVIGREAWSDKELADEMLIGDLIDKPIWKWL